ncbi:hypothetical protein [Mycolicibacterium fortuitum]|uniref:Uncharacterized protein n=1 Tax=Mycobacterium phage Bipper TaxID=1805457 RepID=A0A142F2K1_9CAUD|nr:hypothetical protein [Mycolicibacterium fortuitum]YP_009303220.1 hypothetical protein KCH39_gp104 [Mycobacterium phage Bipper]AMQ67008.1 hypothetical protein SEA_BIPPER_73 [Mycobacterium phage Bipper]QDF19358.1 hypothetical protein SEA_CRACKLEWINK_72 [Mycobacterium phage Cracklewink]UBV14853.1 hypothetical protein H8Z57_29885 [Mycolicibacterium fortuitum]
MSAPQPGSQDHHKVELIAIGPDTDDIALAVLVHADGRVRFNGTGAHDREWMAETLERIVAALRTEPNGK